MDESPSAPEPPSSSAPQTPSSSAPQLLNPSDLIFQDSAQVKFTAQQRWLKNREVLEVLRRSNELGLSTCQEVVPQPSSGQLLLYDRSVVKHFRRDSHGWKKKRDGKTVREDHEKLKIDSIERITCCYAHSEEIPTFHRRVYWLIPTPGPWAPQPAIADNQVLVHYLDEREIQDASGGGRGKSKAAQAEGAKRVKVKPPESQTEDTQAQHGQAPVSGWAKVLTQNQSPGELGSQGAQEGAMVLGAGGASTAQEPRIQVAEELKVQGAEDIKVQEGEELRAQRAEELTAQGAEELRVHRAEELSVQGAEELRGVDVGSLWTNKEPEALQPHLLHPDFALHESHQSQPQVQSEGPLPLGPVDGVHHLSWQQLAQQVVMSYTQCLTEESGSETENLNRAEQGWQSLVQGVHNPEGGQGLSSPYPQWQNLLEKAAAQHHSSISPKLYPSWQMLTEKKMSHHADDSVLAGANEDLEDCMILDEPDHQLSIQGASFMQDMEMDFTCSDPLMGFPPPPPPCEDQVATAMGMDLGYSDTGSPIAGCDPANLPGLSPSGPDASSCFDGMPGGIQRQEIWDRLQNPDHPHCPSSVELLKAFDALQGHAASTNQVYGQWHQMVEQVSKIGMGSGARVKQEP